jgi:hypothetical protein
LLKFELNYAYDRHGDWGRVFSPEELRGLFERNSIRVVGIYGRFMEFIPKEIQEAREWSGELFSTVYEIKRHLRNEPLVIGMADELILVGEKLPSRGDVR